MKRMNHLLAVMFTTSLIGLWAATSLAAGPEAHETRPNRSLIGSGIVTLGISYGAAAIVGAQSDHAGDKSLFVPVAGPWMDLTSRGGCDAEPCGHETFNKVLLVTDGIIQALGALDIVAGFLMPEPVVVAGSGPSVQRASFQVAPVVTAQTYGVAAVGTF